MNVPPQQPELNFMQSPEANQRFRDEINNLVNSDRNLITESQNDMNNNGNRFNGPNQSDAATNQTESNTGNQPNQIEQVDTMFRGRNNFHRLNSAALYNLEHYIDRLNDAIRLYM